MIQDILDHLNKENIKYEIARYNKDVKNAVIASQEIGLDINKMLKTILLKNESNNFILVLTPCNSKIDLLYLNSELNSNYNLTSLNEIEEVTGYLVGTVTPILLKNNIDIYIFQDVMKNDMISIGSGEKGIEIIMRPEDLLKITKARLMQLN